MAPQGRISRRVFGAIATAVIRRPWWFVGAYAVLAAASVVYTAARLEMKTDQNDLVSADLPYNQRYLKFLDEFGDLEFLYVVVVVDGDRDRAVRVVEDVASELGQLTEHVERVFHRVPPVALGRSALLLAPRAEVEGLAKAIEENRSRLEAFERVDGFSSLLTFFAEAFDPAFAEGSEDLAKWGFHVLELSLEALAAAARGEAPSPFARRIEGALAAVEPDPRRRGYLFSENGALAFVEIMPKKDYETLEVIREPLEKIRAALDRVRARHPGVEMGLTGRPVLQADEMKTTNDDMTYSMVLAFAGVVGLFVLFFKRLRRPILAGATLCVAIALTFGLVTLAMGYLTLLSIVFAVMLVGIGMGSGVVLVARYQEELLATGDVDRSLRATLLATGLGVWTGAITTSCAFFSTMFVSFKGLAELGFVAGAGVLLCVACMLTLLPSLIHITDHRIQKKRQLHPPHPVTIPLLACAAGRPRLTLSLFGLVTAVGFLSLRGIPYDANLLELQARGLESVEYEMKIIEKSERSTWRSAFVVPGDLAAVDRTAEALRTAREAGIVDLVESVRDFVPSDQEEKVRLLAAAHGILSGIGLPAPAPAVEPASLDAALEKLLDRLYGFQDLAAKRGGREGSEAMRALEGLIGRAEGARDLLEKDASGAASRLAPHQVRWFQDLGAFLEGLKGYLKPPLLTPESLPLELRCRFVSRDGSKYLVYAYPKKDVWQEEHMEDFVEACRKVDPDVTGEPVQVFESARLMYRGFLQGALYSLVMVSALLLLDLRSLKDAVLTMVPVLVGSLWMLQLMPLLGLEFNLANFFALSIMIGCGVDAGVHMVHRFRETGSTADVGRTTGSAVTLATFSNVIGFSSMGIAQHRGVMSLGLVTGLGCLTVLVASVILLPCFLEILKPRLLSRPERAKELAAP